MADVNGTTPNPKKRGRGRPRVGTPAKKRRIQAKLRSRVALGEETKVEWRELKDRLGLESDSALARRLLDRSSSPQTLSQPPTFDAGDVSSVGEHSESEELESSLSHLNVCDPEDEAEINALENTQLSVDIDYENWGEEEEDAYEYFDDVEKDPDYVPSVTMRTSSTILGRDIETYGVITPGEEVYDHALSVGVADETDDNIEFPDEIKVNHSGDIKDEQCSIVYTKSLLQLVEFLQQPADKMKCRDPKCSATGQPNPVAKSIGTGIVLKWYCGSGHLIWKWHSQPRFKYGLQAGDFMLSSSILLSGNNYSKVSLMSSFMNLGCVCETTFLRVQRQYCVPVIETFWQRKLQALVREMKRRDKVVLLGDGRMDSPGHSAQYCTYTVLDGNTRAIVAVEVVDKRQTDRKSSIMEKRGFEKAMDKLLEARVPIEEVCTDAHPQIGALMNADKGKYGVKGIFHSLDVWHGAKNLMKKLIAAGQEKSCTDLKQWTRDIINHFWWCCNKASTFGEFIVLWKGVLHHVCDVHTWAMGQCDHNPISADTPRTKTWLVSGSPAHKKLATIILNPRWLKTTHKYLRFRTTSDLESFQNHILMYASKRYAFSPPVYEARCQLAALDYNEHKDRAVWKAKDGHIKYKRRFQKKSERWSIYVPREPKKYLYIKDLQAEIVDKRVDSGRGMSTTQPMSETDPRRLASVMSIDIRELVPDAPDTAGGYDHPVTLPKAPMLPHHKLPVGSMSKLSVVRPWLLVLLQGQEIVPGVPVELQDSPLQDVQVNLLKRIRVLT
ncbi:hypothetical protein Bbelb_133860 [Branchiostoma belcheri]|nr:hypothetical protein Bbelb_133860 [Branchiostoma belcheri]